MGSASTGSPQNVATTTGLADSRGWLSLLAVSLVAAGTIWRWHRLGWFWGAVVLLLFLRAGATVLSARAASADPEEDLKDEAKPD